jgi:ankyrin repeat protein
MRRTLGMAVGLLVISGLTFLLLRNTQARAVDQSLVTASSKGDVRTIKRLLSQRPAAQRVLNEALCAAVDAQRDQALGCLIEAGANPNCEVSPESTLPPLSFAVCDGHLSTARVLLQHGADPNQGQPMLFAVRSPHPQAAMLMLLRSGVDVDQCDNLCPQTALMEAAQEGKVALVKSLLSRGADPARQGIDGSALHLAELFDQPQVAKVLAQHVSQGPRSNRLRRYSASVKLPCSSIATASNAQRPQNPPLASATSPSASAP